MSGHTKRTRISSVGPLGPWQAMIAVDALHLARGVQFEVLATWTGPPAIGFPPSIRPVASSDCYVCGAELELARAIAIAAEKQLRAGGLEPPDLRDLAQQRRDAFRAARSTG
ncbi:MAG: hypothetical protein M3Y09_14035 [Actinomycetota bacterium]|nr:hypothetical protein [Actinomycetota bacterium]